MASQHDRLDTKLTVLEYTDSPCGSLNIRTGEAEYCGYDCPTLKRRLLAGEDLAVPLNPADGHRFVPFDPQTVVGP